MVILKIKQSRKKAKKCWFNYIENDLVNTPKYVVKLTQKELNQLLEKIKEENKK